MASPEHHLKVRWFLYGDYTVASSRYQGYQIHRYLRSAGVDSSIVWAPVTPAPDLPWTSEQIARLAHVMAGSVVVIQKLSGPMTERLVSASREAGSVVWYVESDLAVDRERVALMCDGIICPSRELVNRFLAVGATRVYLIPDSPDLGSALPSARRQNAQRTNLRLCWIGHPDNWAALAPVRHILGGEPFADYELVTVSSHPEADVRWSLSAVERVLRTVDVGVIPVSESERSAFKSANRAIRFMAAGVPVIADAIPAYEDVVQHGRSGFLCRSQEDWCRALAAVRDPILRHQMSEAGLQVASSYLLPVIGRRYLEVLSLARPSAGVCYPGTCKGAHRTWSDLQGEAALREARQLWRSARRAHALRALACGVGRAWALQRRWHAPCAAVSTSAHLLSRIVAHLVRKTGLKLEIDEVRAD